MHLRADFRPPQFGENFWHAGLVFGASFFAALADPTTTTGRTYKLDEKHAVAATDALKAHGQ